MSFFSKRRSSVTKNGLFFFQKKGVLFFNLFQKIFCQRLISKVYDFHIGLSQTDSFKGSFFKCFSQIVFSYVFGFSNVFCFCKVFCLTNVFQMLFPYFRCFFVSCSQGFFFFSRFLLFSRINFLLKDYFSVKAITIVPNTYHHPQRDIDTVVYGDDFVAVAEDDQLDHFERVLENSMEIKRVGRIGPGRCSNVSSVGLAMDPPGRRTRNCRKSC